jgi:hypothetical protein
VLRALDQIARWGYHGRFPFSRTKASNAMNSADSFPNNVRASVVLAWVLLLVAAYYTFRWVPLEPLSAAGDLAFITPAVASLAACLASILLLLVAGPVLRNRSLAQRAVVVLPVALSVLLGAVVYLRSQSIIQADAFGAA